MTAPTTTLDARFSDPDANATSWEETAVVLEQAQLFWITTVRTDGRPHVTPLVAVWFDRAIRFCTGAEEQKAVNLRTNPLVALTTGCNDWKGGLDVVVEGEAVRTTDDDALRRLTDVWRTKWDGEWQFDVRDGMFRDAGGEGGEALVYTVRPTKVLAFGKGSFTHTRHTF